MPGIEKKTILAIDDDVTILTTVRTILEGSFEVSLAKTADMAKTILKTTAVDLILLDMEMPGTSGLEFLGLLQDDPYHYFIPVIIVSSHGTADYIIDAMKKGARDFVVKPINPRKLLEKVNAVLRTSRKKTNKEFLLRQLSLLEANCRQGKPERVAEIINNLEGVYYNLYADKEIADIIKHAKKLEYAVVAQEVSVLQGANLFEEEGKPK